MVLMIDKLNLENCNCDQEGCGERAVAKITFKNIFKHKFQLCKKCLNKFYTNVGKFLTPKSPKNILKKEIKNND